MYEWYNCIKVSGLGVVLPKPIKISAQWILYYDGSCSLCISISRLISALDIFNAIIWVPYQSLRVAPCNLSMSDNYTIDEWCNLCPIIQKEKVLEDNTLISKKNILPYKLRNMGKYI